MKLGRNRVLAKNFSKQKIVKSSALSEYDVISDFRTSLAHCSFANEVFRNFFISQPIKFKFGTGIQNWTLILIFVSKSGFGDDSRQYDTDHYFTPAFGQTPLRNSFVMATPKVSGDQKLFERVCHVKTKSDKVSVCYT